MDRSTVSRRLKAGRWLAGHDRNSRGQLIPLSADELAKRPPLLANRISANRIEEIEQEKVEARQMELEKIAQGLGLETTWFDAETADLGGRYVVDSSVIVNQLAIEAIADEVAQRFGTMLDEAHIPGLARVIPPEPDLADALAEGLEDEDQRTGTPGEGTSGASGGSNARDRQAPGQR